MNTFTQTLSAIVIGGLILGGIGLVSYNYMKKEKEIKHLVERFHLSDQQARHMWSIQNR
jgi:hypothetical protein